MEKKWKFGRAANGTVVHEIGATTIKDQIEFARCDKKIMIQRDSKLGLVDVTCAKCTKYADYKAAMAELEKPDPSTEKEPANVDTTANSKATANVDATANSGDKGKKSSADEKISTENYKDKLKAAQKPAAEKKFLKHFVAKTAASKKIYIVHVPTGQSMFNDVEPKALNTCLKYLNNVKIKWEKKSDKMPKGFLSAIKGAFEAAYKSLGLKTGVTGDIPTETPEESAEKAAQEALALLTPNVAIGSVVVLPVHTYKLTEDGWIIWDEEEVDIPETEAKDIPKTEGKPKTEAKGKRKIKRRAKKDKGKPKKRTIKRRKKTTDKKKDKPKTEVKTIKRRKADKYGFTKGTIRAFVAKQLENGGAIGTITKRVAKFAGIEEKKANSKVKAIIRKFRKTDTRILVYQMKDPSKDIYKITEKL